MRASDSSLPPSSPWKCPQKQTKIANQQLLFHRQSEPGMAQMMKDTLGGRAEPGFLGHAQQVDAVVGASQQMLVWPGASRAKHTAACRKPRAHGGTRWVAQPSV
ncbi:hypothetical protein OH809_41180 [Streptomyces sp. NBC_00873]|uniref:hypothetical protein n=1 Tax=Streptomyces sp. NBC_00873 TaxID=2975852 RepID=UPI0038686B0F|nr:hypothetical protein OH809_41180 [Streptomyces sp. NBC_00873]